MTDSSLLVIHQGALGDVVLTFPALIRLRPKFENIDILCQNQLGKLTAKLGLVDKWHPLEAACFGSLFSDQIDGKIRDLICDYAAILVFSLSPELKKSLGLITDSPCLRVPPRPPAGGKIHTADFLVKCLIDNNLLEYTESDDRIFTRQKRRTPEKIWLIDTSKILIHPGSGSIRKRWPLGRFSKLADALEKRGLQPQFVCGPAELDLAEKLRYQNREVHRLRELTELSDLLKSAGGYVGNDSGVSHLAAFLGLPSVVVFGPADPARWKPLGPRVEIVRPELDCSPCFETETDNCAEPRCMLNASLQSVLKAFDRVYKYPQQ